MHTPQPSLPCCTGAVLGMDDYRPLSYLYDTVSGFSSAFILSLDDGRFAGVGGDGKSRQHYQ
jgi:hypothetical protein